MFLEDEQQLQPIDQPSVSVATDDVLHFVAASDAEVRDMSPPLHGLAEVW